MGIDKEEQRTKPKEKDRKGVDGVEPDAKTKDLMFLVLMIGSQMK